VIERRARTHSRPCKRLWGTRIDSIDARLPSFGAAVCLLQLHRIITPVCLVCCCCSAHRQMIARRRTFLLTHHFT